MLITTDLREPLAGQGLGLAAVGVDADPGGGLFPPELRDPDEEWWALEHAHCAYPSCRPSGFLRARSTSYEDLGDPQYQRPHLSAHLEQRVQPIPRRRHDRQAGPRHETERAPRVRRWATIPMIVELRTVSCSPSWQTGDCDLGLQQPLLPGAGTGRGSPIPGRSRVAGPGWCGRTRQRVGCWGSLSGRTPTPGADPAPIEYLTDRRPGRSRSSRGSEFAANPAVPPSEHIRGVGGRQDRPDRRRESRPAHRRRRHLPLEVQLELTLATADLAPRDEVGPPAGSAGMGGGRCVDRHARRALPLPRSARELHRRR